MQEFQRRKIRKKLIIAASTAVVLVLCAYIISILDQPIRLKENIQEYKLNVRT